MNLTELKGIGQKRAGLFADLGVFCVEDLLDFLPVAYMDCTRPVPVAELEDGLPACVAVTVTSPPTVYYRKGLSTVTVRARDESGAISLYWFNQPYRRTQFTVGQTLLAYGTARVTTRRGMANPHIVSGAQPIVPLYRTCKGITQPAIRAAIAQALETRAAEDLLPEQMRTRYDLISRSDALFHAHFPSGSDSLQNALRRLAFERALLYFLAVAEQRQERKRHIGLSFATDGCLDDFLVRLPFAPTNAQLRVMNEIAADMAAPSPMNRLIQGDVGCGKTAVALYALTIATRNGKQGVLMAPTEILARQHFESLLPWFGDGCALLLGSQDTAARKETQRRIQSGEAAVVIGTHAVLSEGTVFADLGLVIADEQHRFGVAQRARLLHKSARADMLVMSATPIPRTLFMVLYGDLDVSVIDELPPGRLPVKTRYVPPNKRADMIAYLGEQTAKGAQCYLVCPCIEPSEMMEGLSVQEVYAELEKKLPKTTVGQMHGRLSEREKTEIMRAFAAGEIGILVCTTVIEVGVHVPTANIMVIEGADRFGLATLHQLRGRIGRGADQAFCFLLSQSNGKTSRDRLSVLLTCSDGFAIAEKDLTLRGAGEYYGKRQHGTSLWESLLADVSGELLQKVSAAAEEILVIPNIGNNELLRRARQAAGDMTRIAMN
ncbi:MAG: ATP-dependent DNA helicase RecG [Clostridiales bacterium]|nr:ATP-dependent DNA helicase RecG [Clostridiales bacterium]